MSRVILCSGVKLADGATLTADSYIICAGVESAALGHMDKRLIKNVVLFSYRKAILIRFEFIQHNQSMFGVRASSWGQPSSLSSQGTTNAHFLCTKFVQLSKMHNGGASVPQFNP